MNSRWQANKVGLIDFWYYDIEEFYFADGRMLLRGSNGSGKSVTMQSFIPLILDGNMRPERLDPFGSRARRMENYLLEENDGREERTGYLYMEFKRQETDVYMTIGIGMRARKNKKLEAWYFLIQDGRRVGEDFLLYKDVGSKIVLTKRELKNRIGEGGFVFDTQSEYMEAVNRVIFGFETLDGYKEMIDLLIQLRTPKLSKDFKPSVINEILSNSLQMLSEDDLRPMSEAIENMDGLKTNVETLKESLTAAKRISVIYDRYNRVMLSEKAKSFLKQIHVYEDIEKQAKEMAAEMETLKQQVHEALQAIVEREDEQKRTQEELDSLEASDVRQLKKRELSLEDEIKEKKSALSRKEGQLQAKEDQQKEKERRKKAEEENGELRKQNMTDLLEDMEEEISELEFDEFAFLKAELNEDHEEDYSFGAHKTVLGKKQEQVEAAVGILQAQELKQGDYDEKMKAVEQERQIRDQKERERNQCAAQLEQIKAEAVEQLYIWQKDCRELKLSAEEMQQISNELEQYGKESSFGAIRDRVREAKSCFMEKLQAERISLAHDAEEKGKQAAEKKEELELWQKKQEPEPELTEAVRKNREALQRKKIPYIQFYQAVDFEYGISQEQKDRMEEALFQMGILDALIISQEYREQVLKLDPGLCDRYIFSDADRVRDNLEKVLTIDNAENDILFYQQVSGALDSIAYSAGHHTAIYADGSYQLGSVTGTITGEYQSKYIGVKARLAFKEQQIMKLTQELVMLEEIHNQAEALVEEVKERLRQLEKEFDGFISGEDLTLAWQEYDNARLETERVIRELQAAEEKARQVWQELNELKRQAGEICSGAYLPVSLSRCIEIRRGLDAYKGLLMELESEYRGYRVAVRTVAGYAEDLQELENDLDNLRYEKGTLVREKKQLEASLESTRDQLKLKNYDDIKERLDYCTKRLQELPSEIKQLTDTNARAENQLENLQKKQVELEVQLGKERQKRQDRQTAFAREYQLGYVDLPEFDAVSSDGLAEKLRNYLGETEKKNAFELQGDLQGAYHENRALLSEYQLTLERLFENVQENEEERQDDSRIDLKARYAGVKVSFPELLDRLGAEVVEQENLLGEKDRELFEDILANTVSKKIRARISASRIWVEKMNKLMNSMKTSSGLTLSLKWRNKNAEHEDQLGTKELVELLQKDSEIMRQEEVEKLSRHFRSKIAEARKVLEQGSGERSFHAIMREILDYRKWFEFQLECQKTGENKKELTDRVFFTFSGGEKAMSMYVPLFSAVVAKYESADADAPRLISLDEAFAGVDDMNIRDMFRLMVGFEFNFMINSQVLYGDYDTVPALAIYQLERPENAKYVTVIRYYWNGMYRALVTS